MNARINAALNTGMNARDRRNRMKHTRQTEVDERVLAQTRRQFFRASGLSLAPLALTSLVDAEEKRRALLRRAPSSAREMAPVDATPFAPRPPHYTPRAKRVIFLFMVGGPSQLDLFEHKPELERREGEPLPDSFLKRSQFAQIQESHPKLFGSRWKFSRHGQCGAEISELMPHTAGIVDHITILRTLRADDTNHFFAELHLHTGSRRMGSASLGSWVTYGLGSSAETLPGFVVLSSGGTARTKSAVYGNGFLPSAYQGVPLRSTGDPILNLASPPGFTLRRQKRTIRAVQELNEQRLELTGDPEIAARLSAYEMAFRMQSSAPELLDLGSETSDTLDLYGLKDAAQPSFGRNCLIARRLVERGVRFVQLIHADWDHHSHILPGLPSQCAAVDQASAALVLDLKQRGLLKDTLVVWGGEFGRSSVAQTTNKEHVGRDHHLAAYTMWFAGGGVKEGATIGATDELGCFPTDPSDSFHIHDLQATILHLLGLDHTALTYRFQGRDFRLTDVYGEVIEPLLA